MAEGQNEEVWTWAGRIADLWSLTEPVRGFLSWVFIVGGPVMTAVLSWLGIPLWQAVIIGLSIVLALLAVMYGGVRIGREISSSSRRGYLPAAEQISEDTPPDLPLPVSPRDATNREKIAVLVQVYANPAYDIAVLVTHGLFGGLEGYDGKETRAIVLLLREYISRPCVASFQDLKLAVTSPEETAEGLRQKLWDFLKAYQDLVCWTNYLSRHSLISTSWHPGYNAWQEKHKELYQKLKEIIASDDFFTLPENLQTRWDDLEPQVIDEPGGGFFFI